MSGELVPKPRVVRCPKCRLLLQEPPGCDLYKCGECGTTLQAKKRRSVAVNSEPTVQETDAAPRNALDLVSEGKQRNGRKHLVPSREDSLKEKATSSGERHLDENGECNGNQLVPFILSDEGLETESDMYNLSHRRHRVFNKGCSTSNKITHSEIEEINDGNLIEESKDGFVCSLDEDGNNDRSTLMGVKSEMEITEGDLEGAEELNNEKLPLEGEKEFISESDGEDTNKHKSAVAGAILEVEITEGDLEGVEELNNECLSLEGEKVLISDSNGGDANKHNSAVTAAIPEVEITESDSKGAEDLNGGYLLPEEAEEELSSALEREDANNDKSAPVGESLELEITENNIAEELNDAKLSSEGAEHAPDGEDSNNDQSAIEGAKPEVDTTESASTTKRSSREKENILHVTPDKLEEGKPANPASSHKQQKQAQKIIHHGSDHIRSVDITDTTELIDPSSELCDILEKLAKSPTTGNSYAYDGSLSSYDGMDEQFPIQHSGSIDNTYTNANGVSEGRTRKGKGLVNSLLYGDLATQHQSRLSNAKHHSKKDSWGNQNKVVETTRNGHRRWTSTKRDEFPPKMPFHRSGSHSYYERGSPSNQIHDELFRRSSFASPDSFEDTDQEKMKLLRMIYRLQDQLNRTRYTGGEAKGRVSKGVSYKGNHISAYHSHDFDEGRRFSHDLDYPSCNGRCSHGVNWRQRHNKFSRIPYSAEATNCAHHADQSCYHCWSQERHFSAGMSPHALFQHEGLHRSYPGQDCCSFSHHSYPSSPQWFTSSKPPPIYGRETKPDDQRRRAPELRKYLREKKNLAKRHQRPVAGGAPFVTCHKCLNLLQLPANFFPFKRTCNQLKCGQCSEVLKFSFDGSHIVFFSPNNAIGPPSSDLNDQSQVISSSNLPSASHANYYHYSPAETISYYDDYGLSISKSYSSEGEPVSLAHSHHLHVNEYDNPSVSHGICEPSTEKENIAPTYSSARKGLVETDESAIFSSIMSGSKKLASEMEARPAAPKSSSLHQLMGYSSPSQVIRGTGPSVEGN
ncbi:Protein ENHANCED DISEASE RESISTANCE 4, partial [Mucuna pruriens]